MSNRESYSDAAKRVHDRYSLHRVADPYGTVGKWFAVKLHDGDSDGVLYDSKSEAVSHQHHDEMYYAYVQITPAQLTLKDAETFLAIHRRMYDKGLRLADRDHASGGRDMIRRLSNEDQMNQLRALFIGDRKPSNLIIPGMEF